MVPIFRIFLSNFLTVAVYLPITVL